MNEVRVEGKSIQVNLSPDAFHMWAMHYFKCKQDFKPPHGFSPVPYFLLCRAIELEIKAKHLRKMRQKEVKKEYSHNLTQAYQSLDQDDKVLTDEEFEVLECASEIYASKGFEYFNPMHALKGYTTYPDLEILDAIAIKLIDNFA